MLFVAAAMTVAAAVKPGVEVLRDNGFKQLAGKRVGLITNPTGIDNNLKSTVDILHEAANVELVALFGPEHGVRGDVHAGDEVGNSVDPATGVKVYSIYGKTKKPTPEMLEGIDALVYDIQDIGCRSFTFVSTLGLALEACAENDIELVVLDRPNPLGGEKIEGSYVEDGYFSFVSQYRIPYIYGLTVGELALLINGCGLNCGQLGDRKPSRCNLTVIPMSGWSRDMLYKDTGLPWVLPSPNIPSDESALCYPASGLCGELYGFLNIGVGYTLPFQTFAAEWIDAESLKEVLDSYHLPGVAFRTIYYTPFAGSSKGNLVQGVQYFFTNYGAAAVTEVQFYVMQAIAQLYPDKGAFEVAEGTGLFDKVCGSDYVRETFGKRYMFSDIEDYWRKDVEQFRQMSRKYYLYK